MNTPNNTPIRLAHTVLRPARVWIQCSGIITFTIPAPKTPTISRGKICLTKRQVSQSHSCNWGCSSPRAATTAIPASSTTSPMKRPVKPTTTLPVVSSAGAAISRVAATRPVVAQVHLLVRSSTDSSPRQAARAMTTSMTMSSAPWKLICMPSSAFCRPAGTFTGRASENQVRVSTSTCKVPTMSTANSSPKNAHTAGLTRACWSNRPTSVATWLSLNTAAMIRPMAMPKTMDSTIRAMAMSMPMAAPV